MSTTLHKLVSVTPLLSDNVLLVFIIPVGVLSICCLLCLCSLCHFLSSNRGNHRQESEAVASRPMTFASYQSFTDTMTLCGDFNTFSYTSNQQMQHPGDGAAGHVAIKCLDGEVFIVTDEDPRAKSFSGGPLLFKDSADGIRSDAYKESGNRMSSAGELMLFNDSMDGIHGDFFTTAETHKDSAGGISSDSHPNASL